MNEIVSEQRKSTNTTFLIGFVVVSLFFVSLTAYTKYIYAKDYSFYIEGECDPEKTSCFVRSCDEYCPPNGLEVYSAYYIDASVFPSCTSNDCANICNEEATKDLCEPIVCTDDEETHCSD